MATKKMSAKARVAARKQRDKWKNKRWYTIRAPRHPWNFKQIGETLGETEDHIMGRVYEMTQQEFSGDFTKMHVVLRFRVTEVVGQDALTTFVGHAHQSDHTRRQVRRYRGKVDDAVDVVSTDGYLIRLKPLMITERRVQTSVKQAIRAKSAELIRAFAAKSTYSKIQEAMLGGDLETEISNAVKVIYPCKTVVIRKSQLLQVGVVTEKGPTLDEIHAEEARAEAEMAAKKAAAIAAAESGEVVEEIEEEAESSGDLLAAAEAMESISEKADGDGAVEESTEEVSDESEKSTEGEDDLMKLKKAELVEKAKAAGVSSSGTKADIVARLLE
ncbi:MAG: hypothetical protein QGI21_01280 [Candidatus Poseidoniaceae archaeon]|jgi:small subunit ribosomal protein S3Ae|nr:hypothetical protein [Candidatus Poseidoniaceae archaeon]